MCVRATTKLWSYYKAVTSLQNLSLKIGRENGPGVTEDSLFMLLTVMTEKNKPKCSLDVSVNILCLHLNLKCTKRMRQSVQIRNEKC